MQNLLKGNWKWFGPGPLEHVPLHHNGDRGVDLSLPLLGQFDTILFEYSSPNILTQIFFFKYIDPKVAEFGGTLGLFLGFSFITIWDGLVALLSILSKNRAAPA